MIIPAVTYENDNFSVADTVLEIEDVTKLGAVGRIHLTVSADNLTASEVLKHSLSSIQFSVGPFTAEQVKEAISWLDSGARRVVLKGSLDEESLNALVHTASQLPRDRVAVKLHYTADQGLNTVFETFGGLSEAFGSIVLHVDPVSIADSGEILESLQAAKKALGESFSLIVAGTGNISSEGVGRLHRAGVDVIAPALLGVAEDKSDLSDIVDAGRALVACLRSDRPDRLFTTVVTDESGIALGLVYSSSESICAALESGRGVYYSRSRGGLWRKGETSGNYQELIRIDLDCDSDAVRFSVKQLGPDGSFCHLLTRTCWGEVGGLHGLEQTLMERKHSAPAGSYTKRLFEDPELLRNKLLEEAQELAEAEITDDIAAEAADLIYFALTRCVAGGATLGDIESHLNRRALKVSRRPGNAKAYRIEAANKFLEAMKGASSSK